MKNKAHRDLPWKPKHWVGDRLPIHLADMEDMEDDIKRDSAAKATAAILKAMRK